MFDCPSKIKAKIPANTTRAKGISLTHLNSTRYNQTNYTFCILSNKTERA